MRDKVLRIVKDLISIGQNHSNTSRARRIFKGRASKPDGWGLDGILDYFQIPKTFYGYQKISGFIQYAKQDLVRKGDFASITKSSKTKLTKAVNYNKEDVNCLFKAIEMSLE